MLDYLDYLDYYMLEIYNLYKWSEFTSQVVRVYFTSGPSLLQKWCEFKLNVYLFKYIIPQNYHINF